MVLSHAAIIPLIGGEAIGAEMAYGSPPSYLLSYSPFESNEKHLRNWYSHRGVDVPYIVVDQGGKPLKRVDVVHSICPCAGLSFLSKDFSSSNEKNEWLKETTRYVLGELKPQVFWGENSPNLAGAVGESVRDYMRQVGRENGYSMSIYVTKSTLHGVPQVRKRAFYFFWKGERVPIFNWYDRNYTPIEDLISNVTSNFQMEPISGKTPSVDDVYYRYVLEEIHGGISHNEFARRLEPSPVRENDILSYIEFAGHTFRQVGEWLTRKGLGKGKDFVKCQYRHDKLVSGGSVMRRGTVVPKDKIGAFVDHYPLMLTHPVEDRYITYREAMTIMGLPADFELLDPRKSVNHICQNVPVKTATDMASEVLASLEDKRRWESTDYGIQDNTTRSFKGYETEESSLEALI